jgi:hypothetical protein
MTALLDGSNKHEWKGWCPGPFSRQNEKSSDAFTQWSQCYQNTAQIFLDSENCSYRKRFVKLLAIAQTWQCMRSMPKKECADVMGPTSNVASSKYLAILFYVPLFFKNVCSFHKPLAELPHGCSINIRLRVKAVYLNLSWINTRCVILEKLD